LAFEALTRRYGTNPEKLKKLSEEEKINFLEKETAELERPETRRNQINRLFNMLDEISGQTQKSSNLAQKAGLEIIRRASTGPEEIRKTTWDVPKLLAWWTRSEDSIKDWTEIRNDAILFYQLVSGRRASNAAEAGQPKFRIRGEGILFAEARTKMDRLRKGIHWLCLKSSNPSICPVRVLDKYIDHPKTRALASHWSYLHPHIKHIPLFLKDEEGNPTHLSPDRVSTILREFLIRSQCDKDSLSRRVLPSFIRHTSLTRANLAGIPEKFIRQMQGRKQKHSEDKHYLLSGALKGWSDLMLHIKDECEHSPSNFLNIQNLYDAQSVIEHNQVRRSTRVRRPNQRYLNLE
jgi:hypothetical protein